MGQWITSHPAEQQKDTISEALTLWILALIFFERNPCQSFPVQALLFQEDGHLLLLHIAHVCTARLLKLNRSACKKSNFIRLFFLEKIHLTINTYGNMSLFMKLIIYLNVISETEMH